MYLPWLTKTEWLAWDQLALSPVDRLGRLAEWRWPGYRHALQVACGLRYVAAVCGPVAAALHGAANLTNDRLDVFYREDDYYLFRTVMGYAGASLGPTQTLDSGESRTFWYIGDLSITSRPLPARASFEDDTELMWVGDRQARVVKSVSLLALSSISPWNGERVYLDSLDAAIRLTLRPPAV